MVLLGDGGGVVPATLEPLVGADRITELLSLRLPIPGIELIEQVMINGWPALILRVDGRINTALTLRLDGTLITGIYLIRNPEKLSRLDRPTMMTRSATGR